MCIVSSPASAGSTSSRLRSSSTVRTAASGWAGPQVGTGRVPVRIRSPVGLIGSEDGAGCESRLSARIGASGTGRGEAWDQAWAGKARSAWDWG